MHPDCLEHLIASANEGIEIGFVSNGYKADSPDWWDILAEKTLFTGFSVNAGTAEDYTKVEGVPKERFGVVVNNLREIAERKKKIKAPGTVDYKFLLDEINWKSIYEATKIASEIGCNYFQFRPAINPNTKFFAERSDEIYGQINQAKVDFEKKGVYEIVDAVHKFNKDFTKKHDFEKCRATMLSTTWCADGKVYMCTDTRGNPWAYLCDHYPDPRKVIEYWGSKEHWEKVDKIDFKKNCDRCTLGPQNEYFEKVFIDDKMQMNLI